MMYQAIQMSSGSANRRTLADINYTDKRRIVWSDLAIHASQHVHVIGDRVGLYGACMDWLHAPDGKVMSEEPGASAEPDASDARGSPRSSPPRRRWIGRRCIFCPSIKVRF
jgi:hypothetical protein